MKNMDTSVFYAQIGGLTILNLIYDISSFTYLYPLEKCKTQERGGGGSQFGSSWLSVDPLIAPRTDIANIGGEL